MRLRLYDMRLSRLPSVIGVCPDNVKAIASAVNTAQERLLFCKEAGDEGWMGSWSEIAFNVSRDQPYITLPRDIARLESVVVCNSPVPIRNQFYEYLQFGNGRMPKMRGRSRLLAGYTRNNSPTFKDLTSAQKIAVYITNPDDADGQKRIFLQGVDSNGNVVYSQDTFVNAQGIFLTLESPFVITDTQFIKITGIQKDITLGEVQIFQVDPNTGAQVLISTLEPNETVASYRRYYFDDLPCACCPQPNQTTPQPVQVLAIAKLDLIPVAVDTDYLMLTSKEAIIEEAQAVRYSEIDTMQAKQMAQEKHTQAVRLLNGQLVHFLGKETISIRSSLFGSAKLEYQKIGALI